MPESAEATGVSGGFAEITVAVGAAATVGAGATVAVALRLSVERGRHCHVTSSPASGADAGFTGSMAGIDDPPGPFSTW